MEIDRFADSHVAVGDATDVEAFHLEAREINTREGAVVLYDENFFLLLFHALMIMLMVEKIKRGEFGGLTAEVVEGGLELRVAVVVDVVEGADDFDVRADAVVFDVAVVRGEPSRCGDF